MTEEQVQAFCANNGISVSPPGEPLHVVDPESLPEKIRQFVNDDGTYRGSTASSERAEQPATRTARSGSLPDDFPGRSALQAAGITTYAQLRKAGDVTEIAGIGSATAEKINAALDEVAE